MKYKTRSYVVSQMVKDYEKRVGQNNRLVFDCPIQRPEGQWANKDQSLLIHSILQDLLIPNVCIVQNGADDFEPMTVLDGKQRMTIVYNYVRNNFKLSKATPPVEVVVAEIDNNGNLVKDENGITKTHTEFIDIKNKKFEKLSREFQDKIKNFEFTVTMITEATKKELEEQIFRFNNGKSPTATFKAFMRGGIDVAEAIKNRILDNNFFSNRFNMTPAQVKGGEDMKCAFHILALLTSADFNKLTSGDLTKIAESMKENWQEGKLSEFDIEYCNNLLEDLNLWLPDEGVFNAKDVLTTLHIPIMVMNVEKAQQMMEDERLTVEQYKEFLKYWVTKGFYKEEYRECSEGSPSDKKNIERRINFMEKELCDFAKGELSDYQEYDIPEELINLANLTDFVKGFISTGVPHNTKDVALKTIMQFTDFPIRDFTEDGIKSFVAWVIENGVSQDIIENCIFSACNLRDYMGDAETNNKFSANDIAILIHRIYADGEDLDQDAFELWLEGFENGNHCEESGSNNALLEKECFMKNSFETFIKEMTTEGE